MDRRPRSLTVPIPAGLSLDLLPPMDSSDSTCRAGWSWLTVSSRCPQCLQAGARWVSLGAGRPPSRSTLPRRSTSPRAETSTPHPAGTRVEPEPRRGVPRRRCIPSHSAWKGRGPWWWRPPQEKYEERIFFFFFFSDFHKTKTSTRNRRLPPPVLATSQTMLVLHLILCLQYLDISYKLAFSSWKAS